MQPKNDSTKRRRQMQDYNEPHYIMPSTKYTMEEELDAVKVITFKVLVATLIAFEKDKTKKESITDWWTEYVLSIKTQKQAAKEQAKYHID
jgi:hypothetical protein